MKTKYTVALAMLAGAALGAAAVNGLNAQGKAPGAYAVFALTDIGDPAAYKANVVDRAVPLIKKHGGNILVATNDVTMLREPALKRLVVIAFDSVPQAKAWYDSDEMKSVQAYFNAHSKGSGSVAAAASQ
jgi:uncharacterized protein (DUF1330 family)